MRQSSKSDRRKVKVALRLSTLTVKAAEEPQVVNKQVEVTVDKSQADKQYRKVDVSKFFGALGGAVNQVGNAVRELLIVSELEQQNHDQIQSLFQEECCQEEFSKPVYGFTYSSRDNLQFDRGHQPFRNMENPYEFN